MPEYVLDGWMSMYGWMDGKWADSPAGGWMGACMHGCTDVCGWTEGWMVERVDGWGMGG